MDTNEKILKELQEYAQLYFSAIVEANTKGGECRLRPGKYAAKELANRAKCAMCENYALPEDEMFDKQISLNADDFECEVDYRAIFSILANWEQMMRAGKQKAVFEVGAVEEKTAKVLVVEKNALGEYKTKGTKVQHVAGNWWMPRKLPKNGMVALLYELNGVVFEPGLQVYAENHMINTEEAAERCKQFGDAEMITKIIEHIGAYKDQDFGGYIEEVARRAGIDLQSPEAVELMATAMEKRKQREKAEEQQHREAAEEMARIRREQKEREEAEERAYAERRTKAVRKFADGKMISRLEFEMAAEAVGYEINIRTLGTLRKRITWIEVQADNVTVYGTKTRRGLDGTFEAIRQVYALAKESAAATETAGISTPQQHAKDRTTAEANAPGTPQIASSAPSTTEHPHRLRKTAKVATCIRKDCRHYAPPIRGDCGVNLKLSRINKTHRLNLI